MNLSFILLAILTFANCELFHLGLKNYSTTKNENLPLVVYYYGTDRTSKKFLNDFVQISEGTHETSKKIPMPEELNFGLVDTVIESKLIEKTQISDFPTAYLFLTQDLKLKYTGSWNAQAFGNWIKKSFRDNPELNQYYPSSYVAKFDQLQTKFGMFKLIAILVTPAYRLAPLKTFVQAAKQLPEGYVFCHVHDPGLGEALAGSKDESALIVFSKNEDLDGVTEEQKNLWRTFLHYYEGDMKSSEDMLAFLRLYTWRGFFYVDDDKIQKLQRRQDRNPTVFLVYNKTVEEHQQLVQRMRDARYNLVDKCALGLLDINSDAKDRVDRYLQIKSDQQLPFLFAIKPVTDSKFYKYKDFTTLDPIEFYERIMNEQVTPFFKDQGILPLDQLYDKAGVLKLTRTSYYSEIQKLNEQGKDIIVYYTARICEPCQLYMPEFHSAAKKILKQLNQNVIVARIDQELNELDISIDSYPHIKMFKSGEERPITLQGDKQEIAILKFVRQYSNWGNQLTIEEDL